MTKSHNHVVGMTLLLVTVVGIAGLYFATSASDGSGGIAQTILGGRMLITGADTSQVGSADFDIAATVNIQFKSFVDSNSIVANITPNQGSTTCSFITAEANGTGYFFNNSGNTTLNLTPVNSSCSVSYATQSENGNTTGAFGVENLGSINVEVNASDPSGCTFGASCTRQIVANQQLVGDCNTTNSSNYCIRTVTSGPQGGEAITYTTFGTSPVTLCDNLDAGGGLEIDLNYTFTTALVPAGLFIENIDFIAGIDTDPNCQFVE